MLAASRIVTAELLSTGDRGEREVGLVGLNRNLGKCHQGIGAAPLLAADALRGVERGRHETACKTVQSQPVQGGRKAPRMGGLVRVEPHGADVAGQHLLESVALTELLNFTSGQ